MHQCRILPAVGLFAIVMVGCGDPVNTRPIEEIAATHGPAVTAAADRETPQVVVLASQPGPGRPAWLVDLALVNPTAAPATYTGYRMDSYERHPAPGRIGPVYVLQLKTEDGWRDQNFPRCGTGLDQMVVRPKEAGLFQAALTEWATAKIGVRCTWVGKDGAETTGIVWSEEVVPTPPE